MGYINKFKLKILPVITIIYLLISNAYSNEIKIIVKINNEIITNADVEKEYKYLISLNTSLQDIDKNEVLSFAKQSIIKEKIKKIELQKIYELNQKNQMIDVMIEGIYQNLNLVSKNEFLNYLEKYNLDFDKIYKKIEIESLWNQMIFEKYQNKVIIDEESLKEEILKNPKQIESYYLYELVYDYKNRDEIINKYKEIMESIESIGFKETAQNLVFHNQNKFWFIGLDKQKCVIKSNKNEIENLQKGKLQIQL